MYCFNHLVRVSTFKTALVPPAALFILAVVSAFLTTSINPISSPVAMHPYGFNFKSSPSFFHSFFLNLKEKFPPILIEIQANSRRGSDNPRAKKKGKREGREERMKRRKGTKGKAGKE